MAKFVKRKDVSDRCEAKTEHTMKPTKSSTKKARVSHNRQYCDDYLKVGFSWSGDVAQPCQLCAVSGEKMANESMVPNKLQRHFTTKHSCLQDKDLNYFQRLLRQQSKQRNVFQKTMTMSERAQIASIEVAEIIAMKSKSHPLAESVILPVCKKMVKSMLVETTDEEISKIPLSIDTIHRRILDLSVNIDTNVQINLKDLFALIVDESTDISSSAQLLVFVPFITDDEIINQFLCSREMPTTTRGQDIFYIITGYPKK